MGRAPAWTATAAWATGALTAALCCSRGAQEADEPGGAPPPLAVGAVVCDAPSCLQQEGGACPPEARVAAPWLRGLADEVLAADPTVRRAIGAADAAGLSLRLHREAGAWQLALSLAEPGCSSPAWVAVPLQGAQAASVRAALVAGWARLAAQRRLGAAPTATLLEALAADDPERARTAMRRLGERGERRATAAICDLLRQHDDPQVLLQGVGALVALGDRRAVPTLIDLALGGERPFAVAATFAIGQLGGDLARAYLLTVASGHADPRIAQAAAEALAAAAPDGA